MDLSQKSIDWQEVLRISKQGGLGKLLKEIPTSPWNEESDHHGWSLIHFVCAHFGNVDALVTLVKSGCNVEKRSFAGNTLLHLSDDPKVIEVLCAVGADLLSKGDLNRTRLDYEAEKKWSKPIPCYATTKILMSNGVRLKTLTRVKQYPQHLVSFEQGILKCISVIVTILGLKKRQIPLLVRLDRFLIKKELAVAIWTTRSEEQWSEKEEEK